MNQRSQGSDSNPRDLSQELDEGKLASKKILSIYLKKAVEQFVIKDYYRFSVQVLLVLTIGLLGRDDFLRAGFIFRLYVAS